MLILRPTVVFIEVWRPKVLEILQLFEILQPFETRIETSNLFAISTKLPQKIPVSLLPPLILISSILLHLLFGEMGFPF